MNNCGIYKIRNIVNGKVYVGSSINIRRRFSEHKAALKGGRHGNNHIQRAWNYHGETKFEFSIIELCSIDTLIASEQKWIDELDSFNNGYNQRPIADNSRGWKHSIETLKKLSAISKSRGAESRINLVAKNIGNKYRLNKKHSDETKLKMSIAHRNITDEIRKKIGDGVRGRVASAETRLKKSILMSGAANPMFGKKASQDTRDKMSASRVGLRPSQKAKERRIVRCATEIALKNNIPFSKITYLP